jgi:hypothetical protein
MLFRTGGADGQTDFPAQAYALLAILTCAGVVFLAAIYKPWRLHVENNADEEGTG